MRIKRTLLPLFGLFLMLSGTDKIKAQSQVAIVLNEYCVSNTNAGDGYGNLSDWVEIYNAHTSSVSLAGYYLSNDRKVLKKWAFPNSFTMAQGGYSVVWLSGKNAIKNGAEYHTSFTIDQCRNQWLILSNDKGVVRDSIFVRQTKIGHSWGRQDNTIIGINAWKLYTTPSPGQVNQTVNTYDGYLPTPKLILATTPPPTPQDYTASPNKGGFYEGAQIGWFKLNGITYDTAFFPCIDIWYTTNGDYPRPGAANCTRYTDSATGSPQLVLDQTTLVRFVATINSSPTVPCSLPMLSSFCESNTYFINPMHNQFDSRFGVCSISLDNLGSDTSWFSTGGTPPNPPITTVHVEYYDNKKQVSEGYGLLTRPTQEVWKTYQKGFYITIDDKYGSGCNFEGNIFNVATLGTSSRTVFPTLHMKAGDLESFSGLNSGNNNLALGTGLRDMLMQTVSHKYALNVSPLHYKPVITFVNGKYWGVYEFVEPYDKYYEQYYNKQSLDSLNLRLYHNNTEGWVTYPDNSVSNFGDNTTANFKTNVYDIVKTFPMTSLKYYNQVMAELDKESFIDWMILQNWTMNSDMWSYNIGFAKGGQANRPGYKWHYYLWNMPSILTFTAASNSASPYGNVATSACLFNKAVYPIGLLAGNSHGFILNKLLGWTDNSGLAVGKFQLQFRNRYQDLMNTALKCDNILRHYDSIVSLYHKEKKCHEDPGCEAGPGRFFTIADNFDSVTVQFRRVLQGRCYYTQSSMGKPGCYGLPGPYAIPICRWLVTKFSVTLASLDSVLTPSVIIG